jgi:hypothetical protein
VDISVFNVEFLYAWQVNMSFNPNVLEFVNVTEGDFLKDMPEGTHGFTRLDGLDDGWALFGWTAQGEFQGKNGSGVLANVEFRALTIGESTLRFEGIPDVTYLWGQTAHVAPPIFFDIDFTPENGYFVSTELFEIYEELLALNSTYYSLLVEHQSLLSQYDDLESQYEYLNATYTDLFQSYTQMLADYNFLLYEYDDLDDNYIILEDELETWQELYRVLEMAYNSLDSTHNSLKTDYEDLRSNLETSNLELSFAMDMNYVLLSIAIVFAVSTAYMLRRKSKAS